MVSRLDSLKSFVLLMVLFSQVPITGLAVSANSYNSYVKEITNLNLGYRVTAFKCYKGLLVIGAERNLYVFDALSLKILWSKTLNGIAYAIEIIDLDSDGSSEIIVGCGKLLSPTWNKWVLYYVPTFYNNFIVVFSKYGESLLNISVESAPMDIAYVDDKIFVGLLNGFILVFDTKFELIKKLNAIVDNREFKTGVLKYKFDKILIDGKTRYVISAYLYDYFTLWLLSPMFLYEYGYLLVLNETFGLEYYLITKISVSSASHTFMNKYRSKCVYVNSIGHGGIIDFYWNPISKLLFIKTQGGVLVLQYANETFNIIFNETFPMWDIPYYVCDGVLFIDLDFDGIEEILVFSWFSEDLQVIDVNNRTWRVIGNLRIVYTFEWMKKTNAICIIGYAPEELIMINITKNLVMGVKKYPNSAKLGAYGFAVFAGYYPLILKSHAYVMNMSNTLRIFATDQKHVVVFDISLDNFRLKNAEIIYTTLLEKQMSSLTDNVKVINSDFNTIYAIRNDPLLLWTNPNTNSRIIETLRIFGDFNVKGISIHGEYAYIIMKNATLIRCNLITGEKTKLQLMSINESMGVAQAKILFGDVNGDHREEILVIINIYGGNTEPIEYNTEFIVYSLIIDKSLHILKRIKIYHLNDVTYFDATVHFAIVSDIDGDYSQELLICGMDSSEMFVIDFSNNFEYSMKNFSLPLEYPDVVLSLDIDYDCNQELVLGYIKFNPSRKYIWSIKVYDFSEGNISKIFDIKDLIDFTIIKAMRKSKLLMVTDKGQVMLFNGMLRTILFNREINTATIVNTIEGSYLLVGYKTGEVLIKDLYTNNTKEMMNTQNPIIMIRELASGLAVIVEEKTNNSITLHFIRIVRSISNITTLQLNCRILDMMISSNYIILFTDLGMTFIRIKTDLILKNMLLQVVSLLTIICILTVIAVSVRKVYNSKKKKIHQKNKCGF